MIEIYVGATQNRLTNMGGWGVVLIDEEGRQTKNKGCKGGATQNAMILRGAIEGLSKTEQGCEAKILSNNQYLVLAQQRRANRELWEELDEVRSRRHVQVEYIARHPLLDEARILADGATRS